MTAGAQYASSAQHRIRGCESSAPPLVFVCSENQGGCTKGHPLDIHHAECLGRGMARENDLSPLRAFLESRLQLFVGLQTEDVAAGGMCIDNEVQLQVCELFNRVIDVRCIREHRYALAGHTCWMNGSTLRGHRPHFRFRNRVEVRCQNPDTRERTCSVRLPFALDGLRQLTDRMFGARQRQV